MHKIKLPQLGQSVEEASIVKWYKQEGDSVRAGEVLFSIQTDKAEIECESTADGVLRKILLEPDVPAPVMTVVALVGEADEPLPETVSRPPASVETAVKEPAAKAPEPAAANGSGVTVPSVSTSQSKAVSPRARRRAQEIRIDPAFAAGTGVGGRVLAEDVDAYAARLDAVRATPAARSLAEKSGIDLLHVSGSGPGGKIIREDVNRAKTSAVPAPSDSVRRIPLTPMRRIIAQRMSESMFSAPHYYVTVEVDMSAVVRFRESLAAAKPSFTALILYAAAKAIQRVPQVNARWHVDAIEELGDIHLGFAVALPDGLVAPVVRSVQTKSLDQIDEECRRLTEKARHGKLAPNDYSGSTFTISNLGPFGIDHFTAIINPPNSAILAVGRIRERPIAADGGIFVRPMMNITMSSDHRVIDGAVAARFMSGLREILETADFQRVYADS